MMHAAPFYYRPTGSNCSIDGSMIALRLRCCFFPVLVLIMIGAPAHAASVLENVGVKQRYEKCLSLANLNPTEALRTATEWSRAKGGAPAGHCLAMALTELKRYPEAAARLDALGRAPDMGNLRASVFDQAGNAWMLAGEAARATASFSAALALSANDADLYADLARAQAMQKDWRAVEADLSAALELQPRRVDFLILRASALEAQGKLKDARDDVDAALKLKPNSAEALVQRGDIARTAGDAGSARRDFQAALKIAGWGETADAARNGLALLDETGPK
jgi:tetratricopeptide (TPR) repeat protein